MGECLKAVTCSYVEDAKRDGVRVVFASFSDGFEETKEGKMKTRTATELMLVAMLVGLLWLFMPTQTTQALGGACSWNGSVNVNWSNPGNWDAGCTGVGGIPGTGDSLIFPAGRSNTAMNDDLPSLTLQALSFTSSLSYTITGTNPISLTSGIDVQAGNQTINTPLKIINNGVVFHVAIGSNLDLGGRLELYTYNLTATVDTAAGVTGLRILNKVTGSSPAKISKGGAGDLRFFGDQSSSSYDIDLNAGSISTNPAASTYLPYDGMITLASGTNLNLLSAGGIGAIAGSGNIHASSFFQIRQHRTTTFTGDIFGFGQLAVIGDGSSTLTIDRSGGSLSYAGEINLNAGPGILKLVNTTATSVPDFLASSGILELSGSHVGVTKIGYSSGGFSYSGALILSGTIANVASQITVQTPNCTISSVVNSATDYGRVNVTSPIDFGGNPVTFSLSGSYVPNPRETFNILQNTNAGTATKNNATFAGLPQGGAVNFNTRSMIADYQAAGNTTFALTAFARLYLPLIMR